MDSSVVLATFFGEPGGEVFFDLKDDYRISAFNLGEVASRLTEKGYSPGQVRLALTPLIPNTAALTVGQAIQSGLWRAATRHLGLSLGDRCCLALGLELDAEVWTCDRAWAELDLGVRIRVIR